jgi:hypothetical protein
MNKLGLTLAIAAVAALNVIVVAGAGLPDSVTGERLLAIAVPIMDVSLVLSSVLLGRILLARGVRTLGIVFLLNIGLFAIAIVMRVAGSVPSRWLLFTADAYWLNLYLIALSKHWSVLSGQSAG